MRDVTNAARAAGRTREALLDAALAVFNERTYGDTAVAMVADRAGVSVGTLYRHFPSKEALGNAVYRRWKLLLLGDIEEALSRPTAREVLRQFWLDVQKFATDHSAAFAFLEFQQHAVYLDDENRAMGARIEGASLEFVRAGQRSGEIRSGNPEALGALVYGALVGLCRAQAAGLVLTDAELAEAEEAVWDLLAAK